MKRPAFVLMLIVLILLIGLNQGCGSNPLGRRAVSGQVTLNGVPIESGSIDFQPLQGGGVGSGAVITDGSYTIDEEQGLPTGKYKVTVFASDPNAQLLPPGAMPGDELPPSPPPKQVVPPDWNETIEVKAEGPVELNFEIKTKK